jgi:hypothetical protein
MNQNDLDHRMVETIRRIVRERNAVMAGLLSDRLRDRAGLNYQQTYDLVNSIEPISLPAWETLMYEADTEL